MLSKLKTFNSRLLSPCEGTECFHLYVTLRVGPLLIVYTTIRFCSYSVCPITLPIFVDMSNLERLTATTTTVSHLDRVPARLDEDEWLRGPSTSVSDELSMTFSPRRSGGLVFIPAETRCVIDTD